MEIDRSYHPLDADLVSRHYLPGFTGAHDVATLETLRKPMERAYGYAHLFKLRAADKLSPSPEPPRLKDRMRALMGNPRAKVHARDGHPGFDVGIYLYGRPFLITEEDPQRITDLLELLLAETREDEIVRVFREQLEHFDIDVAEEVAAFVKRRPPVPLTRDKVGKLYGKIFDDRQVLLRDALLSLGRADAIPPGIAEGALEEDPDMEQRTRLDPVERLAHYAGHGLGLMMAEHRPFWCHGTGLDLCHVASIVGAASAATTHGELLSPLYDIVPEARPHATVEIGSHYTAGAYVPAAQVAPLLSALQSRRDALVAEARARGTELQPERLASKLVEALTYARHVRMGLLEVSDVRVADQGGMP